MFLKVITTDGRRASILIADVIAFWEHDMSNVPSVIGAKTAIECKPNPRSSDSIWYVQNTYDEIDDMMRKYLEEL